MWDNILNGCAYALAHFAWFVGDWGLAIIIVTLIIRLILFPLQRKQFKSSHDMQKVQPRLKEIQKLYEGDQQKIQEETMKVYQETGFNPLAGCLPMLVQMPVFIILFQVLRWKIGDYWQPDFPISFYNILPNLTYTVQDALNNSNEVNVVVYVVFALLFIALSIAPMILQFKQNQNQQQNQIVMMVGIMGIMFIWMAFISPAGVLVYWALSSGFGFVQQLITNRRLDDEEEKAEEAEPIRPVAVSVQRKEKKKRPHKKS